MARGVPSGHAAGSGAGTRGAGSIAGRRPHARGHRHPGRRPRAPAAAAVPAPAGVPGRGRVADRRPALARGRGQPLRHAVRRPATAAAPLLPAGRRPRRPRGSPADGPGGGLGRGRRGGLDRAHARGPPGHGLGRARCCRAGRQPDDRDDRDQRRAPRRTADPVVGGLPAGGSPSTRTPPARLATYLSGRAGRRVRSRRRPRQAEPARRPRLRGRARAGRGPRRSLALGALPHGARGGRPRRAAADRSHARSGP